MKFEVLDLVFSPDLASLDFHLFGPLNKALRSRQFADDDLKQSMPAFALSTNSFSVMASESLCTSAPSEVTDRKTK
jgi:hypothetical protein